MTPITIKPPSRPQSRAERPEANLVHMKRELAHAVKTIGEKANAKYPSFRELRKAFRWVDESKDGKVTRSEVRNFFRVFSMPVKTADYMFSLLGRDGEDE